MGSAHWLRRLFFVFVGLIVLHVAMVGALSGNFASAEHRMTALWQIWLVGGVIVCCGALATWYCARRIAEPLAALTRQAHSLSAGGDGKPAALADRDEFGVLAGAFDQMQRDLAGRLDQIQQHGERLQTVLGNMAEGVLAVAADKTILLANDAGRRLLDFVVPDPIGRPLLAVTRVRPVLEAVNQAFISDSPVVTEFDAPGGLRRTLSLRATRLPGAPCPGVMVVLHDMTELRRLENVRRDLVANVSHELKTPLAAIKGYAETLRLGAVNDPEHNVQFVSRIEEQADRLHQLILDILQIARIESGQAPLELVNVVVVDVIEQCVRQFAEAAEARRLQLSIEMDDRSAAVRADEDGLRTVVSNLVDNAIKYTPDGGRIVVRTIADPARVILEVEDTGIGIAEKDLPRIFERFYRADKARSRERGGTVLGLSIVKHLVQSCGGTVNVESELGRGSKFRIELPRAAT
jgi:two-component system phosphate regulon sensor histidine kinase PhoR